MYTQTRLNTHFTVLLLGFYNNPFGQYGCFEYFSNIFKCLNLITIIRLGLYSTRLIRIPWIQAIDSKLFNTFCYVVTWALGCMGVFLNICCIVTMRTPKRVIMAEINCIIIAKLNNFDYKKYFCWLLIKRIIIL